MDEQEVRYSFTGDLGDLKSAVSKAMGFLDQYAAKFKKTDAASTMKKSQKSFQDLRKSLNDLGSSFRNTNKQTKSLTSSMRGLSDAGSLVKKALFGLTGIKLGGWLADATKESISYIENLNLFRVAMGQSAEQGLKFVDTMSEVYGMDPSNLYRYSGYFYELTDAIGMADAASATLSLSMTKAANDIASLFNIDIETVVNNLASGMQGMSRSVRKYGMDIRAVTLQQTALAYGLTEQVENMSEADRMALRYLTMMNQVRNATSQVVDETVQASGVMGDFARNIETPANQLRIFKEQVSQLGRAIGNFLIPMLSKLLPIINGVIMAIRTVLTFLSALTGFRMDFAPVSSGASDLATSFGGVADAAEGASRAVKELKKTLAPFDEINLLQAPNEDTGGGGGVGGGGSSDLLDPALAEAIQNMSLSLEDIEMKANKVRDSLLKFFGFDYVEVFNPDTGEYEKKLKWFADQFEANLINKFPQWRKTITALFENWNSIIDGLRGLFTSLGEVITAVKDKVVSFFSSLHLDDTFSAAIESLPRKLSALTDWISAHTDQIANFILLIGQIWAAFRTASVISTVIAQLMPFISVVTKIGQVIATLVGSLSGVALVVAAIIAALAVLYARSEAFRKFINSILGNFKKSIPELWNGVIKPVLTELWDLINSVLDLVVAVVDFLFADLGPTIAYVANTLWDTVVVVLEDISLSVQGIIEVLRGVIEFITGVFTGDWARAWNGVVEVFTGIANVISGIFTGVVNAIIGLVNSMIGFVWSGIQSFVNSVLNDLNALGRLFGQTWTMSWGAPPPAIGYLEIPKVGMATGGVVTGPTEALIGEGRYDEAVIPLGNSPQMNDFADKIAGKINPQEQIALLREQNQLLRGILEQTGNSIGIKDLTRSVTRIQRQETRMGGI